MIQIDDKQIRFGFMFCICVFMNDIFFSRQTQTEAKNMLEPYRVRFDRVIKLEKLYKYFNLVFVWMWDFQNEFTTRRSRVENVLKKMACL